MSLYRQAEADLDRSDQFGAELLRDTDIDFAKYEMESEAAKVRPAHEWAEQVRDYFYDPQIEAGHTLPWSKTHEAIKLRAGELSIWAGVNGHGKSLLLNQVVVGLIQQKARICIASLEMKPLQTMVRMTRQAVGGEEPAPNMIATFHDFTRDHLWLYDQQGTVKHTRMLGVVRYCHEELGIDHFVIDSLMKCGIGTDDYNAQKTFVDRLSTHAKDTGMHIHLVAHSRKRENANGVMDKFDVKGASEITDMADNVFTLWRNKKKEEKIQADDITDKEKSYPDAILVCDKQRNGEWEGKVSLWFVKRALQFAGKETTQALTYV